MTLFSLCLLSWQQPPQSGLNLLVEKESWRLSQPQLAYRHCVPTRPARRHLYSRAGVACLSSASVSCSHPDSPLLCVLPNLVMSDGKGEPCISQLTMTVCGVMCIVCVYLYDLYSHYYSQGIIVIVCMPQPQPPSLCYSIVIRNVKNCILPASVYYECRYSVGRRWKLPVFSILCVSDQNAQWKMIFRYYWCSSVTPMWLPAPSVVFRLPRWAPCLPDLFGAGLEIWWWRRRRNALSFPIYSIMCGKCGDVSCPSLKPLMVFPMVLAGSDRLYLKLYVMCVCVYDDSGVWCVWFQPSQTLTEAGFSVWSSLVWLGILRHACVWPCQAEAQPAINYDSQATGYYPYLWPVSEAQSSRSMTGGNEVAVLVWLNFFSSCGKVGGSTFLKRRVSMPAWEVTSNLHPSLSGVREGRKSLCGWDSDKAGGVSLVVWCLPNAICFVAGWASASERVC